MLSGFSLYFHPHFGTIRKAKRPASLPAFCPVWHQRKLVDSTPVKVTEVTHD